MITSIKDKGFKYLGKQYNASLSEREHILEIEKVLQEELKKIDKCRLPGRYKSWILQYMLLLKMNVAAQYLQCSSYQS